MNSSPPKAIVYGKETPLLSRPLPACSGHACVTLMMSLHIRVMESAPGQMNGILCHALCICMYCEMLQCYVNSETFQMKSDAYMYFVGISLLICILTTSPHTPWHSTMYTTKVMLCLHLIACSNTTECTCNSLHTHSTAGVE